MLFTWIILTISPKLINLIIWNYIEKKYKQGCKFNTRLNLRGMNNINFMSVVYYLNLLSVSKEYKNIYNQTAYLPLSLILRLSSTIFFCKFKKKKTHVFFDGHTWILLLLTPLASWSIGNVRNWWFKRSKQNSPKRSIPASLPRPVIFYGCLI